MGDYERTGREEPSGNASESPAIIPLPARLYMAVCGEGNPTTGFIGRIYGTAEQALRSLLHGETVVEVRTAVETEVGRNHDPSGADRSGLRPDLRAQDQQRSRNAATEEMASRCDWLAMKLQSVGDALQRLIEAGDQIEIPAEQLGDEPVFTVTGRLKDQRAFNQAMADAREALKVGAEKTTEPPLTVSPDGEQVGRWKPLGCMACGGLGYIDEPSNPCDCTSGNGNGGHGG